MMKYVPSDKGTHWIYTQGVCVGFYLLFTLFAVAHPIWLTLICTLVVAIAVERYQGYSKTGVEDRWDAIWGFCGAVALFFPTWIHHYL